MTTEKLVEGWSCKRPSNISEFVLSLKMFAGKTGKFHETLKKSL